MLLEETKKQKEITDKTVDNKAQEIEELKNTISQQEKKNKELFNELTSIYNSKRFKIINNIANRFTRKK